MSKTLKELAADALQVQNASNLVGVTRSFAQVMLDLREAVPGASTNDLNTHPIAILWADKISSLTATNDSMDIMRAYEWAKEQSK